MKTAITPDSPVIAHLACLTDVPGISRLCGMGFVRLNEKASSFGIVMGWCRMRLPRHRWPSRPSRLFCLELSPLPPGRRPDQDVLNGPARADGGRQCACRTGATWRGHDRPKTRFEAIPLCSCSEFVNRKARPSPRVGLSANRSVAAAKILTNHRTVNGSDVGAK